MSPRKRSPINASLPPGLRARPNKDGKLYYSWTHPIDKREKGLGRDRAKAIRWAREANATICRMRDEAALSAEEWTRGLTVKAEPHGPNNLMSLEQIRGLHRTSTEGGVYFLLLGGVLQYVGMTRCVCVRLERHAKEARIPFDDSRCVEIPETGMRRAIELAYIEKHLPPYNHAGRPRAAQVEPESVTA